MEFFNQIYDNAPITGGVVQDSSGNLLNRELSPTYSQMYYNEKARTLDDSIDNYFSNNPENAYFEPQIREIIYGPEGNSQTANDIINDITRADYTKPEESKAYIERILGLVSDGIYTAQEQNAMNLAEAERVREYNSQEAEKSRAFQLMLRDSQIQSTMKQLKDAGINPLLALSGSLGYANASSPAQASSSHTTFGNDNSIMSALILAVASALGSVSKVVSTWLGL